MVNVWKSLRRIHIHILEVKGLIMFMQVKVVRNLFHVHVYCACLGFESELFIDNTAIYNYNIIITNQTI